jgi:Flp pilus assembly protein TadD
VLLPFLAVVAAVAGLMQFLGWTLGSVFVLAIGVAGAAGRVWITARRARIEGEREQLALDRRVRAPIAPIGQIKPTEIGVDPAAQDMLGGGEVPDYVPRTADREVRGALSKALDGTGRWLVVVHGRSKVGKSRTLFEAVRQVSDEVGPLTLVAPVDGDAVRSLLLPDGGLPGAEERLVVWLDDLETFVAEGVSLDTLREWHERTGAVFAITYGGKGSDRLRDSGTADLTVLTGTLLANAVEISLAATSGSELKRLPATLSESNRKIVEDHGLAAAMVAGPALRRKLTTRRHAPAEPECFEGEAVVYAAVDWARCGRTDQIPVKRLRGLWAHYLPAGSSPDDEAFERGMEWALRPVAGSIALLTGAGEHSAYDYVVRFASDRPDAPAPRPEAWQTALDTTDPWQAFAVGATANGDGDYDHSMVGMSLAARASDKDLAGMAETNIGVLHEHRGDPEAAEAAYRRAIELGNGGGASNLGVLLMGKEDLDGAEAAYHLAIELGYKEAVSNLGVTLKERGDLEGAEAAFREAVELGHGSGAANLGSLLDERGDLEGAEAAYRTAIELGHGGGASNLGSMLRRRGDLDGAEDAFRTAVELGYGDGAYNLGLLLKLRDDAAGAEGAYRKAAAMGSGEAASNLGVLLMQRGDMEAAAAAWRTAVKLGDGSGASNLGVLLEKEGDAEGAEAAFRKATEMGNGDGALNLGVLLERKGDLRGAEDAYRKAAELEDVRGMLNLGTLLAERGDAEGGEAVLREAAELGSGEAASNLGVLLDERGDTEGAEASYRKAITLDHGGGAFNLGVLLIERGDIEGAEAAWRKAAELGSPGGSFNLGVILDERGDVEGARRAFEAASDSDEPVAEQAKVALAELSEKRAALEAGD